MSSKTARRGLVKVLFRLERDESGWPPATVEGVWAKRISEMACLLYNIPFYARGVANGDVVEVCDVDGELYFCKMLRESGHGTIRVLAKDVAQVEPIVEMLESFGCGVEVAQPRLIAADVPPSAQVRSLLNYLEKEEAAAHLGYEVACQVGDMAGAR